MQDNTTIVHRLWNLPDKGELESKREETFIDDIIQKNHIEKELLLNLDGIQTAFDGGGGSGRFSILLAKRGLKVTHFDISVPMLDKARELAKKARVLDNIHFIEGNLEDLSAFEDKSFDLVMSFDAPISYTCPNHEKVIANLVRLAKKKVLFSVASRLGSLPYIANPLQKNQFILNEKSDDSWVQHCINSKDQLTESFIFNKPLADQLLKEGVFYVEETLKEHQKGNALWPITYHFMPEELKMLWCGKRKCRGLPSLRQNHSK